MLMPILATIAVYELILVLPLRLKVRRLSRHASCVAQTLKSLTTYAASMKKERTRVAEQLLRLEERVAQLHLRTDARPFDQAIALAARGAGESSLSQTLGLSHSEAELVRLLHGRRGPVARQRRS
jgi:hypothetical protein